MLKLSINFLKINLLKMSVFTQKLNPLTGQHDWIIQNENYDYHQEVARSSFADMLHDTERNQKYEAALKVAIDRLHSNGKKANVLDIGTGTGLLSMMAVRNGADSVVACEAFKPMCECALKIIQLNEFEDKIKVIPKRSTEITVGEKCDMENRANILVTEVFDTELIGEGALETFKHAHECLLEKDCITIPHSATIYAQIVESPYLYNWNKLKDVFNDDGELLVKIPEFVNKCAGAATVHDIQLSQLDLHYVKTIVSPEPVFRFDWSGKTPFIKERSVINTLKAQCDGRPQGVFMWWDLQMDIDNKVILSCAPYWAHPDYKNDINSIPWRDHWMQAIYYFPKDNISVKKNEEIHLISCHDEYSLWFNLKKDLKITDAHYLTPLCDCGLHIAYSRTRIGQMNDFKRVKKILNVLENNVNNESVILALGNGFISSLASLKLDAKKLIIIDNNHLSKNIIKSIVEFNKFENVEIHEKIDDLDLTEINMILAEPYFVNSILPWDNLMLVYSLKNTDLLQREDLKILPKSVSIKCVPVSFNDLNKIRSPLVDCEGFKMKYFDELIESSSNVSDELIEAQPLWEYPGIALGNVHEILSFELKELLNLSYIEKNESIYLNSTKQCNGIAFWIEWNLDETGRNVISSGPILPIEINQYIKWDMYTRQGVTLFPDKSTDCIKYDFKFDSKEGKFNFSIL